MILLALLTGVAQVFLVVYQTKQIAHGAKLWSILVVGCLISTVWVLNVRAASSGWIASLTYIAGATIGTFAAMKTGINKRDK